MTTTNRDDYLLSMPDPAREPLERRIGLFRLSWEARGMDAVDAAFAQLEPHDAATLVAGAILAREKTDPILYRFHRLPGITERAPFARAGRAKLALTFEQEVEVLGALWRMFWSALPVRDYLMAVDGDDGRVELLLEAMVERLPDDERRMFRDDLAALEQDPPLGCRASAEVADVLARLWRSGHREAVLVELEWRCALNRAWLAHDTRDALSLLGDRETFAPVLARMTTARRSEVSA